MTPIIENPLTWVYFPTALGLGALHALEPGHAKALTAAYLIGIKGTKRDAFLLGLSVATTHSFVVVSLSLAAIWLGQEAFTEDAIRILQIASGVIVMFLGCWMLAKRLRQMNSSKHHHHHHHETNPVNIKGAGIEGSLEIINTAEGERFRFKTNALAHDVHFRVIIERELGVEIIALSKVVENEFISDIAPEEPHEFTAEFEVNRTGVRTLIPFEMHESEGHDHSAMTDDEHARAHAAALPDYAKKGERPSFWQILSFGAAGGMIPCPASVTVMLLAISIGKIASGLFAVAGFSIGLAVTLVGIGMAVVAGISRFQEGSGRLYWFSAKAPIISAFVVILSGLVSLVFAF